MSGRSSTSQLLMPLSASDIAVQALVTMYVGHTLSINSDNSEPNC